VAYESDSEQRIDSWVDHFGRYEGKRQTRPIPNRHNLVEGTVERFHSHPDGTKHIHPVGSMEHHHMIHD